MFYIREKIKCGDRSQSAHAIKHLLREKGQEKKLNILVPSDLTLTMKASVVISSRSYCIKDNKKLYKENNKIVSCKINLIQIRKEFLKCF